GRLPGEILARFPRSQKARNGSVWNLLPRRRGIAERRHGAGLARPTARSSGTARCLVRLKAGNASIARVGLLGLLAQYHGVVDATDRTQRALETERGALC